MLPIHGELIGSIFFPKKAQKLIFDNPDSNTLRMCVHLLLIVLLEFKTVFLILKFWQLLLLPPIALNDK